MHLVELLKLSGMTENGLLVEDGNEQEFADAIEKALLIDFNREGIRKKTIEQYASGKIIQQWESLLMAEIH
jgi:glycosyltransferase involved in cell wall biosynthesis